MSWELVRQESRPFPRNPLELVIAQLRFHPILTVAKRVADFQEGVRRRFPRFEHRNVREFGFEAEAGKIELREQPQFLFATEDGRTTVSLLSDALGIETRSYTHDKEFLDDVRLALEAMLDVYSPVVPTRLGLRFINNIKLSHVAQDLGREVSWWEIIGGELWRLPSTLEVDAATSFRSEVSSGLSEGKMTLRSGLDDHLDSRGFRIDIDRFLEGRFEADATHQKLVEFSEDCYSLFRSLLGPALLEWLNLPQEKEVGS